MSHWRISDWVLSLLVALAVLAAWEGFAINQQRDTGCGGDFLQFYVAGTIVHRGEAERLYDQPYFRHFQEPLRGDPMYSLYPPTLGLFTAPLAGLSYHKALAAWWVIQAICILATGLIFYRTSLLSRPWRINMLVALAALLPLWTAVGIGHLTPMLLLLVAAGLTLHKRGKHGWAGLLLSLLALKPQLAAGLVLWMLLRRDLRTLLGLAAGFGLQALAVAVVMGPGVWLDYLHAMPVVSAIPRAYRYSSLYEQSFTGIASNLTWAAGLTAWEVPAMRITYAITAGAAAVMLWRVVCARRRGWGEGGRWRAEGQTAFPLPPSPFPSANYEYACGVLFMMIFPPHFLIYDQTILAVPLVMLWSSPAWRWGVVLCAAATLLVANLAFTIGFSLTGLVALATMFSLNNLVRPREKAVANAGQPPGGIRCSLRSGPTLQM